MVGDELELGVRNIEVSRSTPGLPDMPPLFTIKETEQGVACECQKKVAVLVGVGSVLLLITIIVMFVLRNI